MKKISCSQYKSIKYTKYKVRRNKANKKVIGPKGGKNYKNIHKGT